MLQTFRIVADGISISGQNINRQLFWNASLAFGVGDWSQRVQHVDPQLCRGEEAAKRVGDIPVDFGRIPGEPVIRRAYRPELAAIGSGIEFASTRFARRPGGAAPTGR